MTPLSCNAFVFILFILFESALGSLAGFRVVGDF